MKTTYMTQGTCCQAFEIETEDGKEGAADVAKNLFLRDDKRREYYLVAVRQDKRVDLKALRRALGSRPLSFGRTRSLRSCWGWSRAR